VIAMGKHGARELNYSSDIDLIFVYDGSGTGRMDAQTYAVKIVEAWRANSVGGIDGNPWSYIVVAKLVVQGTVLDELAEVHSSPAV